MICYILAAILYCLGNLFVWSMGPCPAFSSNTVCEWGSLKKFWLFPGSELAAVVVGIGFFKVIKRLAIR